MRYLFSSTLKKNMASYFNKLTKLFDISVTLFFCLLFLLFYFCYFLLFFYYKQVMWSRDTDVLWGYACLIGCIALFLLYIRSRVSFNGVQWEYSSLLFHSCYSFCNMVLEQPFEFRIRFLSWFLAVILISSLSIFFSWLTQTLPL